MEASPFESLEQLFKKFKLNTDDNEWLEDLYSELKKSFCFVTLQKYKKIIGTKKYDNLMKEISKNKHLAMALNNLGENNDVHEERQEEVKAPEVTQVVQMKVVKLTFIVIGMTGAGKSSLINLFYLWSLGLNDLRDIKKVLIPTKYFEGTGENNEINVADQGKSQTQKCSVYNFSLIFGNTRYELNFMDTPGLGDVEGIKKDDEHIEHILDTISRTPELNCIVLMLNGSEPRINDRILYVITKLKGILPNIMQDNLLFFLSNVKWEPALNVSQLMSERGENIPGNRIIYYDNAIFQLDLKNKPNATIQNLNFDYKVMKEKLAFFLDGSSKMRIQNNQSFSDLRSKRDEFRNICFLIQKDIEDNLKLQDEIQQIYIELSNINSTTYSLNSRLYMEQPAEFERKQVDTNYHSTLCLAGCSINCHEHCGLDETIVQGDPYFRGCYAMCGDYCQFCKHHYTYHVHLRKLWTDVKKPKPAIIDPTVWAEINKNTDEQTKKNQIKNVLDQKIKIIQQNLESLKVNLSQTMQNVRTLCSQFNYEKELELSMNILLERKESMRDKDTSTMDKLITMFSKLLEVIFNKKIRH